MHLRYRSMQRLVQIRVVITYSLFGRELHIRPQASPKSRAGKTNVGSRMLTRRITFTFCGAILVLVAFMSLQAQTSWKVVKTFQVGGEGGWDYLTVDPKGHRLFVPRS